MGSGRVAEYPHKLKYAGLTSDGGPDDGYTVLDIVGHELLSPQRNVSRVRLVGRHAEPHAAEEHRVQADIGTHADCLAVAITIEPVVRE